MATRIEATEAGSPVATGIHHLWTDADLKRAAA
jgi:hypothetical protein